MDSDFILASRLEFEVMDFDGLGPRTAVIKSSVPGGGLLVAVSPMIGVPWGRIADCVVFPRWQGVTLTAAISRWRVRKPAPPVSDSERWAETVLVHVLFPPVGEQNWPQPVDLRRVGDRTWAEAVPTEAFISAHTARHDQSGVIGPRELMGMVDRVLARSEVGDDWTPTRESESGDSDLRPVLRRLADLYLMTKRYAGLATTDLTPELMTRLDAVGGWSDFVESRLPPRNDAPVRAVVAFAQREGHLHNLSGIIEQGHDLEVTLRALMRLSITGRLHPDDDKALESLGDIWKDAFRSRRPSRPERPT